jgi:hypothetical protein
MARDRAIAGQAGLADHLHIDFLDLPAQCQARATLRRGFGRFGLLGAGKHLMGKTAENEKLKLKATFINNLATATAVSGFVVPYFALMSFMMEARITEIAANGPPYSFASDLALLRNPKTFVMLFFALFSVGLARWLRGAANVQLDKMTD